MQTLRAPVLKAPCAHPAGRWRQQERFIVDVLPGGAAAGTCPSVVQDYWIGRPGHAGQDGVLPSNPTKFGSSVATVLTLSSAGTSTCSRGSCRHPAPHTAPRSVGHVGLWVSSLPHRVKFQSSQAPSSTATVKQGETGLTWGKFLAHCVASAWRRASTQTVSVLGRAGDKLCFTQHTLTIPPGFINLGNSESGIYVFCLFSVELFTLCT